MRITRKEVIANAKRLIRTTPRGPDSAEAGRTHWAAADVKPTLKLARSNPTLACLLAEWLRLATRRRR
jgi:hypothetical protein